MTADPIDALTGMDIYLIDQVMKGRVPAGASVLDAGCGGGRNLAFFVARGHPVLGVDVNEEWIAELAQRFGSAARFETRAVEDLQCPAEHDLVICNAVLHFARDQEHATAMVGALARSLRPGGVAFLRFATGIGFGETFPGVPGRAEGWHRLPDESERFLVTEAMLEDWERAFGLARLDPLKTTRVEALRSMTTWVWTRLEGGEAPEIRKGCS